MSIVDKLFSFDGRLRRRDWWLLGLALGLFQILATELLLRRVLGLEASMFATPAGAAGSVAATLLVAGVGLALFWPHVALSVKRAHDRDRSARPYVVVLCLLQATNFIPPTAGNALLLLVMALSMGAALWLIATLGLPGGTPGPNRFGPSPKPLAA